MRRERTAGKGCRIGAVIPKGHLQIAGKSYVKFVADEGKPYREITFNRVSRHRWERAGEYRP